MDLRKVRLQLTALNLVLFAVSIGIVSLLVVRAGDRAHRQRGVVEKHRSRSELLVDRISGGTTKPANTWIVNTEEKHVDRVGEAYVEPPLLELAARRRRRAELRAVPLEDHARWSPPPNGESAGTSS